MPELEGTLPEDKNKMMDVLKWFLALDNNEQMIFRIGRRTLAMSSKDDLYDPRRRRHTENLIIEYDITSENIDVLIERMMNRFV